MHRLRGAYSVVVLTHDRLFAFRDSLGVRPLCLGSLDGGWVVASESCALDHIGAKFTREIEPGEIVAIGKNGLESHTWRAIPGRATARRCVYSNISTSLDRTASLTAAFSTPFGRLWAPAWRRSTRWMPTW